MNIDKDRPSPEWIASLRRRFPVEQEIDRILTRKLENRASGPFVPRTLEELVAGIESLIRAQHPGPFKIAKARWLSGGASKLQVAFELDWERPGVGPQLTPMVLRMEPAESIVETSRLREFQLIKAMEGVVPVPPVFWCDAMAEHLPYPALIYGFAEGVAKPSTGSSGVSGLGTVIGPELRAQLAPQFVEQLAKIHTHPIDRGILTAFDMPEAGTQSALWGVNWWERVWEEDSDEDVPLMRLAASWLRSHVPPCDSMSVVHADYRIGNFLFTEGDGRISAWLDWELGRIGDRHQDLSWAMNPAWTHPAEDGKTLLVSGIIPQQEFVDRYQELSGLSVDPKALHYYHVYNNYMIATLSLATGYRVARNAKTHQDVLVCWLMGIGSKLLEDLRELIERGA